MTYLGPRGGAVHTGAFREHCEGTAVNILDKVDRPALEGTRELPTLEELSVELDRLFGPRLLEELRRSGNSGRDAQQVTSNPL